MTDEEAQADHELSYLGKHSERLSDLIEEQTALLFAAADICIPVKSCSLLEALSQCEPAAASDLANALGRSHQLIMQKLPKLVQLGLIERSEDPDDRRRYLLTVTPEGQAQLERLDRVMPDIAAAYRKIEREVGPVLEPIVAMTQKLLEIGLADRVEDARESTR
ncbi:MarR family winged helix-turn-helix transcriptional regulator [Aurantiacibacter sp. D1-12]|uniref:MarR family winged helix-turn-helix transcriptional regulator n=1 Tax=Aurantiacibacter sp. D1-12 TaxID=2993658 RepID=UPI00237D1C60|nr:MarR family transcriptional regulator [Aurantiacibacter sp. D1-12]MDE1468298.1 winged helix DNA-binding protein [Aurantiacibacter sp. D1-12]